MLATLATATLLALAAPAAPAARHAAVGGARACPGAGAASSPARDAHAVRCLLNAERARRGLRRLRESRPLARAARRHSLDMVRRDFFEHTSPGGSTPERRARRAGYAGASLGETIAWGQGSSGTPAGTVERWMASPGHRRVILGEHARDVGVGVANGSPMPDLRGGVTVTADFGYR